jgi:hypothetical protein
MVVSGYRARKGPSNLDEAELRFRKALELTRRSRSLDHPAVVTILYHLAWVLHEQGDTSTVRDLHGEALTLCGRNGYPGCFELNARYHQSAR